MRILHVLDHSIPLHSGYTFRTRAILEQQRLMGYETFHLTSPKHYGSQDLLETIDGFDFFRTLPQEAMIDRLPFVHPLLVVHAIKKRLLEIIPQIRPDMIHAHSPALNGLAALSAARCFGLPMVYECRAFWEDAAVDHGTTREGSLRYRLTRLLETRVFRRCDAVTTICEGLKQEIILRGISEDKVTVIPNAVDISKFTSGCRPDPELSRSLALDGKTVLGFIGSFYAYEGLSLLLSSLPQILETHPDVRVLLVGGGPDEPALQELCRQLMLNDRVRFTGRVPHHQVQGYYDLVDVFVYPRLPMRLTNLVTPLKPLEAMAQGKLVIASDVGGHRELIRDGETGLLFKAGSASSLARAVGEALDRRETWPTILEAGRRFVEEERSWKTSVAGYEAIYHRLVKGHGSAD